MFYFMLQCSIISIIIIFLIHYLIIFFIDTLTVPKIKDLVNTPVQKYKDIINTLNDVQSSETYETNIIMDNNLATPGTTDINSLPNAIDNISEPIVSTEILQKETYIPNINDKKVDKPNMKTELKQFFKNELNKPSSTLNNLIPANETKHPFSYI